MQMFCVGINNDYTMSVPLQILVPLGADFDGDTISSKTPFSIEANQELYDITNSKMNYIGLTGINEITTSKEGLQALYNLTLVLPEDKDKMTKLTLADFGY